MTKVDVLVVGTHGVSQLIRVHNFPRPGETVQSLGQRDMKDSGKGPNQAICMSLFGCSVAFIGKVGDDENGHIGEGWMRSYGVNTTGMIFSNSLTTGRGLIFLDDYGQNTIVNSYKPKDYVTFQELKPKILNFRQSKIFITSFEIPVPIALKCLKLAKSLGMFTILNPAPAYSSLSNDLSYIDLLIPNETESLILAGFDEMKRPSFHQIAQLLLQKTKIETVLITLGEMGCLGMDKQGYWEIPGVKVEIKDTTGAGDAFIGGLVSALTQNQNIREATKWANYVAALSVTKEGSFPSYPTRKKVQRFIKRQTA